MAEITEGVQISVKLPKGHLVTFGSTSVDGLKKVVDEFLGEDAHPLLIDDVYQAMFGNAEATANATAAIQSGLTGSAPGLGNKAPASGGNGPAPRCQHGERVFRTGNSAKGPWKAWMCPTPMFAADKCKPEWVD